MRRFACALLALALLPAALAAPARAQDRTASCRAFVAEFYRWYPRATEHGGFEVALKQRRATFSPELVRLLKAELADQARTPGEVTGLDFDPFLNAQDFAQRYTVGKVSRRGSHYFADVYAEWNGKRPSKPALTPELAYEHGRWVFTDFHYGPKPTDDLLHELRQYRKPRTPGKPRSGHSSG